MGANYKAVLNDDWQIQQWMHCILTWLWMVLEHRL